MMFTLTTSDDASVAPWHSAALPPLTAIGAEMKPQHLGFGLFVWFCLSSRFHAAGLLAFNWVDNVPFVYEHNIVGDEWSLSGHAA